MSEIDTIDQVQLTNHFDCINDEFLYEIMSYLHLHEILTCLCICRRWYLVVVIGMSYEDRLVIEPIGSHTMIHSKNYNQKDGLPFLLPQTIVRILTIYSPKTCNKNNIKHLTLSRLVLSYECFELLKTFELQSLSLDNIKLFDSNGSNKTVRELPCLDSTGLKSILLLCCKDLLTLSLDVTIQSYITSNKDIFECTPSLVSLAVTDGSASTSSTVIKSYSIDDDITFNGYNLQPCDPIYLQNKYQNIRMSELLQAISLINESILLLDYHGFVITGSHAFEKHSGHHIHDIYKINWKDACQSVLTKEKHIKQMERIIKSNTISNGSNTSSYHTICDTFACKNGTLYNAQIVLLSNVVVYKGIIDRHCLKSETISAVIDQEQQQSQDGSTKQFIGIKNWLESQNDKSYHLLRFGLLSNKFNFDYARFEE